MNKLITTIACLICCIVYTQAQNKNNMLSKKEQSIAAISIVCRTWQSGQPQSDPCQRT